MEKESVQRIWQSEDFLLENMHYYEKTRQFSSVMGQPVGSRITPELLKLRTALIIEEVKEFMAEYEKEQSLTAEEMPASLIMNYIKELGDIVYVVAGFAETFGIKTFYQTNVRNQHIFDISPDTAAEMLVSFSKSFQAFEEKCFDLLSDEAVQDEKENMSGVLKDLMVFCHILARSHGINLKAAFNEIHDSNMSKLGKDGKPIYRHDGKVMKGPNYHKPDLSAFVMWTHSWGGKNA